MLIVRGVHIGPQLVGHRPEIELGADRLDGFVFFPADAAASFRDRSRAMISPLALDQKNHAVSGGASELDCWRGRERPPTLASGGVKE